MLYICIACSTTAGDNENPFRPKMCGGKIKYFELRMNTNAALGERQAEAAATSSSNKTHSSYTTTNIEFTGVTVIFLKYAMVYEYMLGSIQGLCSDRQCWPSDK